MTYRTERAFAAITGYTPRRTLGQRITGVAVYTLLGGLAIWAAIGIVVGIINTVTCT